MVTTLMSALRARFGQDHVPTDLVPLVREKRITLMHAAVLAELRDRALAVEQEGIKGSIIEAGCAMGGSAIVLAAAKSRRRRLFVHDVFGMIPPPSDDDGEDVHARYRTIASGKAKGLGGDLYYGYQENLRLRVAENFAECGIDLRKRHVRLIEGLFQDTLHPAGPVALAHVDGDWYESVKVCLERIWPALSRGGVIVIDDYHYWSGCRKATDEFLAGRRDVRVEHLRRPHLVKV